MNDDPPKYVPGVVIPPERPGRSQRDVMQRPAQELRELTNRSRGYLGRAELRRDQAYFQELAKAIDNYAEVTQAKGRALEALESLYRTHERLSPDNLDVIRSVEQMNVDIEHFNAQERIADARARALAAEQRLQAMQAPPPMAEEPAAEEKQRRHKPREEKLAEIDAEIEALDKQIAAASAEVERMVQDGASEAVLKTKHRKLLSLIEQFETAHNKRKRL